MVVKAQVIYINRMADEMIFRREQVAGQLQYTDCADSMTDKKTLGIVCIGAAMITRDFSSCFTPHSCLQQCLLRRH